MTGGYHPKLLVVEGKLWIGGQGTGADNRGRRLCCLCLSVDNLRCLLKWKKAQLTVLCHRHDHSHSFLRSARDHHTRR